jgi:N-acetyl-gamma-glutamyl-phosphate reductase
MIKAGIISSTGMVGENLIRLLHAHPEAELAVLTSRRAAGQNVADVLPVLAGMISHELVEPSVDAIAGSCDVVFLAMKSVDSMEMVPQLVAKGVKCIDIGGEFRFRDGSVYETWYGAKHTASEDAARAVWGLPEQNRSKIKTAQVIGNPGCYPTSAVLGVLPFLKAGLVERDGIIVNSMSGVSGAGRQYSPKSENTFLGCYENARAYGVGKHKHTPEIEQALSEAVVGDVTVTFVPHLIPIDRGILSTIYLKPTSDASQESLSHALEAFAKDEPFVRARESVEAVRTANVRASNFCDVGVKYVERSGSVVAAAAIDNTIKGAAGQAVQNMNIMFGLDERAGLDRPSM